MQKSLSRESMQFSGLITDRWSSSLDFPRKLAYFLQKPVIDVLT